MSFTSSCLNAQILSLSDSITEDLGDTTIFYDWKECSTVFDQSAAVLNDSVIVPETLRKLSDSELRKELQKYGEIPGPIMPSTRNVYIKRLARLHCGATNSKVILLRTCIILTEWERAKSVNINVVHEKAPLASVSHQGCGLRKIMKSSKVPNDEILGV